VKKQFFVAAMAVALGAGLTACSSDNLDPKDPTTVGQKASTYMLLLALVLLTMVKVRLLLISTTKVFGRVKTRLRKLKFMSSRQLVQLQVMLMRLKLTKLSMIPN